MGSREKRSRRKFSDEYKLEAVRLVQERRADGISLVQVSRELGVNPQLLATWKKRHERSGLGSHADSSIGDNGRVMSQDEELRRVKRELEVMRQERDFLRKAAAFFAKESK